LSEIMICPASGAAAFANVQRTIANGVPWASIAPALAPESAEVLQPLVDEAGQLRFWGFRENSRDHREIAPLQIGSFLGTATVAMMAIADPSGRRPPDRSAVVVGASAYPRSGSTCARREGRSQTSPSRTPKDVNHGPQAFPLLNSAF
jgi:hypothetical protein